jgi:hypothetical protein
MWARASPLVLAGVATDHVGTAAPGVRRSEAPLCLLLLKSVESLLDPDSRGGCPHVACSSTSEDARAHIIIISW